MSAYAPRILGLDTGARQIGVCILKDEELVFYAVKTIKQHSQAETLRRLEKVLTALIAKYDIEVIALEKIVYPQQQDSFVKTVYREAKDFALINKIHLVEYHPKFARRIISQPEKPTKLKAALMLARKYPELTRYFNVQKLWQKRYYAQLFDAIVVGLVCAKEIQQHSELRQVKSLKNIGS